MPVKADLVLPYCMKILHRIKFYSFTVVGRTLKLKSVNFYYYVAKILSILKFKIR